MTGLHFAPEQTDANAPGTPADAPFRAGQRKFVKNFTKFLPHLSAPCLIVDALPEAWTSFVSPTLDFTEK